MMDFGKLYFDELDKVHSLREISEDIVRMQDCIKDNLETIKKLEEYVKELELRCRTDSLTGMWNHEAYDEVCEMMEKSKESQSIGIVFADINGLKNINDNMGHAYGDIYISRFAETLLLHFNAEDCYHISGDEFVIILKGISEFELAKKVGKLSNQLKMKHVPVASLGCAWTKKQQHIKAAIKEAENMMYMAKNRWHQKFYSFGQNVG